MSALEVGDSQVISVGGRRGSLREHLQRGGPSEGQAGILCHIRGCGWLLPRRSHGFSTLDKIQAGREGLYRGGCGQTADPEGVPGAVCWDKDSRGIGRSGRGCQGAGGQKGPKPRPTSVPPRSAGLPPPRGSTPGWAASLHLLFLFLALCPRKLSVCSLPSPIPTSLGPPRGLSTSSSGLSLAGMCPSLADSKAFVDLFTPHIQLQPSARHRADKQ